MSWSIWPPKKPGDAAEAFDVFDRDGDGYVGLADLEFPRWVESSRPAASANTPSLSSTPRQRQRSQRQRKLRAASVSLGQPRPADGRICNGWPAITGLVFPLGYGQPSPSP